MTEIGARLKIHEQVEPYCMYRTFTSTARTRFAIRLHSSSVKFPLGILIVLICKSLENKIPCARSMFGNAISFSLENTLILEATIDWCGDPRAPLNIAPSAKKIWCPCTCPLGVVSNSGSAVSICTSKVPAEGHGERGTSVKLRIETLRPVRKS